MKKSILLLSFVLMFLASCQTEEIGLMPFDAGSNELIDELVPARQITDDVNSKEVDNILDKLFKGKSKSRAGYTISILKDKQGKDAIICVNFAGNGGFALISAVKTHEPILAYAEEGNFSSVDDLKFPLSEWLKDALEDIEFSIELPEDSLISVQNSWRIYEESKPKLMSRVDDIYPNHSNSLVYISQDDYMRLSRIMMDKINIWNARGDRVYTIDDYTRNLAMGDGPQIAGYVQGSINPIYFEDYWAVTVVREIDISYEYQYGSRFETEWTQDYGYNQSFPNRPDDSQKMYVGCGPVAVGQVLYANKHPSFYNWGDMTKIGYGNKLTSDFLLEVKDKCNGKANYKSFCYSTTLDGLANALKSYGYNYKKESKVDMSSIYGSGSSIIDSELKYMENGKMKEAGHAWVVECKRGWAGYTKVEIWTFVINDEFKCIYDEDVDYVDTHVYYVNWGWGPGGGNGYYFFNGLKPDGYLSNTLRAALINIKPKV